MKALKAMDAIDGPAVVREILRLWDHDYGRAVWRGGFLRLATGGWSENEAVVSSLPPSFRMFYWAKSERGGLHVYRLPRAMRRAK